jgi:Flp pilus assembly protein TadG
MRRMRALLTGDDGQSMIEAALTLPIVLLVCVGIFEFGRAFQTWQVLTNAAREGARIAVTPTPVPGGVQTIVRNYMTDGQLSTPAIASATVTVDPTATVGIGGGATASATVVTISYPFQFAVLQPVARLVASGSTVGSSFSMTASAKMRNESQ